MDAARKKLVSRALKLQALAESPNEHEAKRAREQFDAFVVKNGITAAELRRGQVSGPVRKSAGKVEDPWREEIALAVGRRRGCRPLLGRGSLVFEGEEAADAVSDFHRANAWIEEECERYWRSHGHGDRFAIDRVYKPVFLIAAACGLSGQRIAAEGVVDPEEIVALARRLSGHTSVQGCIGLVLRSAALDGALAGREIAKRLDLEAAVAVREQVPAEDQFVLASGFVFVISNRSGSYATMFFHGDKLPFRGDVSAFDDQRRRYVWGFERGQVGRGDRVVFATADREAVGEVEVKEVRIAARTARVIRDPSGEPLFVEGDGTHLRAVG